MGIDLVDVGLTLGRLGVLGSLDELERGERAVAAAQEIQDDGAAVVSIDVVS